MSIERSRSYKQTLASVTPQSPSLWAPMESCGLPSRARVLGILDGSHCSTALVHIQIRSSEALHLTGVAHQSQAGGSQLLRERLGVSWSRREGSQYRHQCCLTFLCSTLQPNKYRPALLFWLPASPGANRRGRSLASSFEEGVY